MNACQSPCFSFSNVIAYVPRRRVKRFSRDGNLHIPPRCGLVAFSVELEREEFLILIPVSSTCRRGMMLWTGVAVSLLELQDCTLMRNRCNFCKNGDVNEEFAERWGSNGLLLANNIHYFALNACLRSCLPLSLHLAVPVLLNGNLRFVYSIPKGKLPINFLHL